MKLFVNARFLTQPVSGVQRYGIECCRKIKKLYPSSVFLTPKNIWNTAVAAELGATVIGVNTGHVWEQLDLVLYLRKQNSPPLFNPCNTAPVMYANNYITLHDLAFFHHPEWNSKLFSLWYNALIPHLVKNCRHLFTVSETMRAEIARCYHMPTAVISVTYNGVAEQMISRRPANMPSKEKIILAVGSFNIRKNHHSLIKAFQESKIKDQYKLVIIGDKNKVFSETGIDELQMKRSNILVYSHLAEADLIDMYQKAEILVSLSVYEGFGIPILEGIYNGCKIVCSDIAVYRELYDNYAVFCNPNNISEIIEAINTASQSTHVGEEGIRQLVSRFNYEVSAKKIIEEMLNLR
ncbi:MAG: glycosyltransferase family 4 protein [Taibaiella sp.]|nr:glycosyltransferase family 4 protein [Taibaiella sp.]